MTTGPTPTSASATSSLWAGTVRLIRSQPRSAVENMALDEAMLLTAGDTGDTLVRLYGWDRPSVSFGRNQRCQGVYSRERLAAAGVPGVRRLTGGRALLHARELTYAVAAPLSAAPTLRGGYEAINEILLGALRSLGVPAMRAVPTRREVSPGLAPCFEAPSAGELVVSGAKLVGSAQHRDSRALLQHGSILLADDQGLLQTLALVPLPAVPTPATLQACHGATTYEAVCEAIVDAVRDATSGSIVVASEDELPARHVEAATIRYRDPSWTWRR